ncbi:glycosyl-4,4'-diaponeurosporenoate acyltransferase [Paenibacillus sp. D51F]
MWLEPGTTATIMLDAGVLVLLHAFSVASALRRPWQRYDKDAGVTRLLPFEKDGRWYERKLGIHKWKDRLPDGGGWIRSGFAKKRLLSADPDYLRRFAAETRRGELTHWLMILPLPLFAVWNNGLGMAIMAAYALAANLPCILVQRYNRARLLKVMSRRERLCYPNRTDQYSAKELPGDHGI